MYTGSCLCGAIRVQIDGPIDSIVHCHCSRCRKTSGTAFATNGFVQRSAFQVFHDDGALRAYSDRPETQRFFCSCCGSPVYSANVADPSRIRLRLGLLDSAIAERPMSHNFVTFRANWEDLDAELPRYEGYEPGRAPGSPVA